MTHPASQLEIFNELRSILHPYESYCIVVHDTDDNYYLNTATTIANQRPDFFAAVAIKKLYVSFHLMPVYYHPELLVTLSPELKKRMQGKSCFNFNRIEEQLFAELTALTDRCYQVIHKS